MAHNPASHANTAREPGPAASSADRAIAPARWPRPTTTTVFPFTTICVTFGWNSVFASSYSLTKAHQELSQQEYARSGDHAFTACEDKSDAKVGTGYPRFASARDKSSTKFNSTPRWLAS
jgi:hypothetical protein